MYEGASNIVVFSFRSYLRVATVTQYCSYLPTASLLATILHTWLLWCGDLVRE